MASSSTESASTLWVCSVVAAPRFKWPEPFKCQPLSKVLRSPRDDNKREALHKEKGSLAKASPKLRKRLVAAVERIRQNGLDPRGLRRPIVVNIDAPRARWMLGR